ncbi:MAG: putative alpha-1,2-mannosidase [Granulosicoccus sp.]|jgi:predicted alpha-1,2-mannosidase
MHRFIPQRSIAGVALVTLGLIGFNSCTPIEQEPGNSQFVNPFIGTGGHGHTFPGATRPFGMVQLSPDTRLEGWDGCSGYHYTDSVVYGFSHTHLSGTGIGDYCDILLKPCIGEVKMENGYKSSPENGYASHFDKNTEVAEAGYYSMDLAEGIKVELTTTQRVGMHRYTFENSDNAHVILDLSHRDLLLDSELEIVNDSTVRGFRRSRDWAQNQYVFFYAEFSRPIMSHSLVRDSIATDPGVVKDLATKAALEFAMNDGEQLIVRVGISAVDMSGAEKNLRDEVKDWDFDAVREKARLDWDMELSKIRVKGKNDDKTIFYSALYHTMIAPNLYSDVDGRYRKTIPKDSINHPDPIGQLEEGENHYTIFSLWDTYRAAHPLYTIIDEERTNEFIRTFLRQYEDGNQLPVWELAGNYTGCMIGYHSIPVIADAYAKGIRDWDTDLALEAMNHSASLQHLGLPSFEEKGFIPTGDEPESVSKTLEYAYDDWCIAMMAKEMNETEMYDRFISRAQNYKNIYNAENGFLQGRTNGGWYGPFVPEEVNFNYTEANGWQYSLAVPQDVDGLIELMGGDEKFVAHLDSMFNTTSETEGRHQVDITGLIGQYAHGNEPSHHMAYLYSYAGQPWKTQSRVREILKTMYQNAPDGLSGNEDCGQMSAWYVLSAMGFYPVCPGSDEYVIGYPLFNEVEIDVASGATFAITTEAVVDKKRHIVSATFNGFPLEESYITHDDILSGGALEFEMDKNPDKDWGVGEGFEPTSWIEDDKIIVVPSINAFSRTFEDSLLVEIRSPEDGAILEYKLVIDSVASQLSVYKEPFYIHESTIVIATASNSEKTLSSKAVTADFKKIRGGRSIEILTEYANQYSAGGGKALIDMIRGGREFRTGSWQGYRGDAEAIVDLGEEQSISTISLGCLQDIKSWIWMPKEVEFFISTDKKKWNKLPTPTRPDIQEDRYGSFTGEFSSQFTGKNARYVKVVAKNYGTCPAWHLGAGGQGWLFVDELEVE